MILRCIEDKIRFVNFLNQGYIEAQEEGFDKFFSSGKELVDGDHYAADEIKEKVSVKFFMEVCFPM